MEPKGDIALIGLAVMGRNLILNMNDHGFTVVAYNRTVSKVDDFMNGAAKDTNIIGAQSIEEMVGHLKRPRRVMMLVKAGQPVDDFIDRVIPYLEQGDIIIDGGNSLYQDSIRRTKYLRARGLLFVGTGVSGGEEGARHGPSIMPGGHPDAWPHVKGIFQAISAKVDDGAPCCDWVGNDGAGHYVKMVHNGIEYGDMQLICEAYHLMKDGLGMSADEMHKVFAEWNEGDLDSYLIEITRDILGYRDSDGAPLVDKILDTAGQKGTGKWTVINSAELGIPITLIGEAVFSRCISAMKEERVAASKKLRGPKPAIKTNREKFIADIRSALYASKSFRTRRASCCSAQQQPSTAGSSTTARSPSCGAAAASSAASSSAKSRRHSTSASGCRTCCSTRTSSARSERASAAGATSWPLPPRRASRHRPSRPHSASSTPSAARRSPPTCCRLNAIISAHTLTSA